MGDRPYTVLSCAISLDGYLDDAGDERLVLSNAEDLDLVDAVRASCDAILVGAGTVRADDPRLLVRDPSRVAGRLAAGLPASPARVTVTGSGRLGPGARLFRRDPGRPAETVVYCESGAVGDLAARLGERAVVRDGGHPLTMERVAIDLREHGVRRLMVEGGRRVLTQFLAEGLADELRLAVAPFLVGDTRACRLVDDGDFPWTPGRTARLVDVDPVGDVAVLRYALSERYDEQHGEQQHGRGAAR